MNNNAQFQNILRLLSLPKAEHSKHGFAGFSSNDLLSYQNDNWVSIEQDLGKVFAKMDALFTKNKMKNNSLFGEFQVQIMTDVVAIVFKPHDKLISQALDSHKFTLWEKVVFNSQSTINMDSDDMEFLNDKTIEYKVIPIWIGKLFEIQNDTDSWYNLCSERLFSRGGCSFDFSKVLDVLFGFDVEKAIELRNVDESTFVQKIEQLKSLKTATELSSFERFNKIQEILGNNPFLNFVSDFSSKLDGDFKCSIGTVDDGVVVHLPVNVPKLNQILEKGFYQKVDTSEINFNEKEKARIHLAFQQYLNWQKTQFQFQLILRYSTTTNNGNEVLIKMDCDLINKFFFLNFLNRIQLNVKYNYHDNYSKVHELDWYSSDGLVSEEMFKDFVEKNCIKVNVSLSNIVFTIKSPSTSNNVATQSYNDNANTIPMMFLL